VMTPYVISFEELKIVFDAIEYSLRNI